MACVAEYGGLFRKDPAIFYAVQVVKYAVDPSSRDSFSVGGSAVEHDTPSASKPISLLGHLVG